MANTTSPQLSVFMICHNALEGLEENLLHWAKFLQTTGVSFEILCINDGSRDGTGRTLDRLRKQIPELRVVHQLHVGEGKSTIRAFDQLRGQYILKVKSGPPIQSQEFEQLWQQRTNHVLVLGQAEEATRRGLEAWMKRWTRRILRLFSSVHLETTSLHTVLFEKGALGAFLKETPKEVYSLELLAAAFFLKFFPENVGLLKIGESLKPSVKIGRVQLVKNYLKSHLELISFWIIQSAPFRKKPQLA